MDIIKTLSKRLRELRQENNYTQNEIAELLSCTQVTYSHYEIGKRCISVQNLVKLAQIYNVSTDYLLGISDVKMTQGRTNECI